MFRCKYVFWQRKKHFAPFVNISYLGKKLKNSINGKYNNKETILAYLFLSPALLLIFVFVLLPIFLSVSYAFTDYYLLRPDEIKFVGLENFKYMLKDELVFKSFKNTLHFVLVVMPLQVGTALGLALLVNMKIKFNTFFRTAFFSPVVMSLVVISILWLHLLNPQSGLINVLLRKLGIPPQPFLTSPAQAMNTIAVISAWQGAGFQMMIFLAGLKNIPNSLYEAAQIDGGNKWQQFIYITLPSLKPTMVFILITTMIAAFKLIVQPMVMTNGGPMNSTLTIVQYIYQTGYRYRNVGYASAIALVFTVIIATITLLQRRLLKED
ncbi:binding-protein-dependent transport systems inner membrane component [Thermoanaerobacter italicus Ab9]|uniref:Binding-protein-dependent transport systems inner membrane component n=1 Tax=Thermoanaerobacter italicus (strain DSM 9252 / Ab9) TaxID=580331 RepID=D3T5G0_THEIA|nr:sugar ABC transporter permease [Thermoanaerobacter italicus]ADD03333.1 binding-protein-dependent transport systems inner membrane component [Thermoanaerobacter italicus Ab9]